MKRSIFLAALALVISAPVAAQSDRDYREREHREYRQDRDHRDYRHRRDDSGRIVGAIIGGVLGAIIGSEIGDRDRRRDYYYYDRDGYYYDRRGGGHYPHGYENYNRYGWRDRRDSRHYRR